MLLSLCSIASHAYDFEVDGFYYEVDLDNMTATIADAENSMSGEILIPRKVSYKNREFNVVSVIGAFAGNTGITSVVLPNSITSLGDNTFYGCLSLLSISGLENVTEIGNYCFSGCKQLTSIALSDQLKEIGQYAFSGCMGLSCIEVPNSVTSIGRSTFWLCM